MDLCTWRLRGTLQRCVFSRKNGTFACWHVCIFPPYPPSGPGWRAPRSARPIRAGWHAHARVGMSWRCRGPFVVPWPRFAWPCHPTTCRPPPSSSRPEGRRPGVEGSVRTALPQGTRRHAATTSSIRVNVDLRPLNAMTQPAVHPTSCLNNQAPNIMTQRHQRCRFATLKEQIPRLRGASLRFAPRRSE